MDDIFADEELTSVCHKLDFKYFFERTIKWQGESRTLFSVIKQWLWEKNGIWVRVHKHTTKRQGVFFNATFMPRKYWTSEYNSPVVAENDSIRLAVDFLTKHPQFLFNPR